MSTLTTTYSFTSGTSIVASQVNQNFTDVKSTVNGNLDGTNVTTAVREQLGLNDGTTVRRGKSIVATEESRTNTVYGLLTTPDRVQSVVLPTDGKLIIDFHAEVKSSVADVGRVALFIGASQQKAGGVNGYQAIAGATQGTSYCIASTFGGGIAVSRNALGVSASGPTSFGIASEPPASGLGVLVEVGGVVLDLHTATSPRSPVGLGGSCEVFLAAGTYDVSAQYKSSSGSVTAKNRRLLVEARGY